MTDEEILARLPHLLHPYLVRPLALRLLRPVELGSPEFHFTVQLLQIAANQPERWSWNVGNYVHDYVLLNARSVDPAFIQRCRRIVQHVKAKIEWRTALLQKRLDQTDLVFQLIEEDAMLERDAVDE
jgi:hypothetical protein